MSVLVLGFVNQVERCANIYKFKTHLTYVYQDQGRGCYKLGTYPAMNEQRLLYTEGVYMLPT